MLKSFLVFTTLFYFLRFIFYIYQAFQPLNQFAIIEFRVFASIIELANFTFLLWIFRPRRQWPEFFTWRVGVAQMN